MALMVIAHVEHRKRKLVALLGGCVLALVMTGWFLRRPRWDANWTQRHLKSVPADVHLYDLGNLVKAGPKKLLVVRFLGPVTLRPVSYEQCAFTEPVPISVWADKLSAPIVFTAGQFDTDLSYLGWLKAGGVWLSRSRKPGWLGLLATTPSGVRPLHQALPFGQIIDLVDVSGEAAQQAADSYDDIMQSMMLLDENAKVRVRHTDKAACRTVVAEDVSGNLLLMVTEGAVTLYDLAQWLSRSELRIRRAMNLDGGKESQLAIRTPELDLTFYSKYGSESALFGSPPGTSAAPLPRVVMALPCSREGG